MFFMEINYCSRENNDDEIRSLLLRQLHLELHFILYSFAVGMINCLIHGVFDPELYYEP